MMVDQENVGNDQNEVDSPNDELRRIMQEDD